MGSTPHYVAVNHGKTHLFSMMLGQESKAQHINGATRTTLVYNSVPKP